MSRRIVCTGVMTFLLLFCQCVVVFAGSINGNEARVISAASGTFTYEGKQYVSSQGSLNSLQAYLSRDDIDLTAEQADEAISIMLDNVQAGVEEGYIVPIGGNKDTTASANKTDGGEQLSGKTNLTKGTIEVEKNGKTIFNAFTPIKNTGFSLNLTFLICTVAVAGAVASLIGVCRLNLLKHEE